MGRNGVKTGRIYIKLYMSIFMRQNFSHPPKFLLSETFYGELPKNLVSCFKGTLAPLLLDSAKTPYSCLFLLNLKQRISPQLLKLQITENHLKPPKIISKRPELFTATQSQSHRSICSHPKPAIAAWGRPVSRGVPGAGCNWSGAIHIHLRAPTIIHRIFETNFSFHVR